MRKSPPAIVKAAVDGTGTLPPRPQLGWSDFHTVLEIAQHGSVANACGSLGMTHSTLLRKLDQIEHRLQTRLFERSRGRYAPTAAGAEIVQVAREFEPIATAAEMRVKGQDLRPSGEVRVSAAPIVIEHLLVPVLAQFGSAFPGIQIELAAQRAGRQVSGAKAANRAPTSTSSPAATASAATGPNPSAIRPSAIGPAT